MDNTTSKPLPPGITLPEPDESLVAQWRTEVPTARDCGRSRELNLVRRAIAWATPLVADQELRASMECLVREGRAATATLLGRHRRPSPPETAEPAMEALVDVLSHIEVEYQGTTGLVESSTRLRRALIRLHQLEQAALKKV